MITILLFIVLLSILVFVHEFGHFITARKSGMAVEEFGFGFPPRLWGIKRGSTLYSINAIPVGGFVKIKGESGDHTQDPDSFASKSLTKRLIVLAAGVTMNVLLGWLCLYIGFVSGMPSILSDSIPKSAHIRDRAVEVVMVAPESPASKVDIKQGDKVLSVDGQAFATAEEARAYIADHTDKELKLEVKRGSKTETVTLKADIVPSVSGKVLGVGLATTGTISFGLIDAIPASALATGNALWQIVAGFGEIIKNLVTTQKVGVDVSGPIGIAVMTGQIANQGLAAILQFAAMLSLNLAVVNFLPFPALDGGRALFLVVERIRGKRFGMKTEALVHNIGFLVLIVMIIAVTFKDLMGLFARA